ncbi:MAG: hypothetical protein M0Z41_21250 [Peptococcaceae bacterium]|jgi:hypothetical protein|nr:hypothetical protein [Peptococcaceae bacterium]
MRQSRDGHPYLYTAFGLHIASGLLLPELLPDLDGPVAPDVHIGLGEVPTDIPGAREKKGIYQVARDRFLFWIRGIGRYYVTDGNRIIIRPDGSPAENAVRLVLLGTGLGSLLLQRGVFSIHGSAVLVNQRCVIFTGVSGVGKSTLSAAFNVRGYPMLTDDVAAVTIDDHNGLPWVQFGYPQHKLRRDSAQAVGVDVSSGSMVFPGKRGSKFALPAHKEFWRSPVRLGAVYELTAGSDDVSMRHLSIAEKLAVMMSNTYRPWLINGFDLRRQHFEWCVAIARTVPIVRLTRPGGMFPVAEQMRLIENDLPRE